MPPSPISAHADTFTADYPDVGTHPRLRIGGRANAFNALTTLVPTAPGVDTVHGTPVDATNGVALRTNGDLALLRTGDGVAFADGLASDAALTVLRDHEHITFVDGTTLGDGDSLLVHVTGDTATVVTDPSHVDIDGDVTTWRVWAPEATAVSMNGRSVAFERCGGYVASSC